MKKFLILTLLLVTLFLSLPVKAQSVTQSVTTNTTVTVTAPITNAVPVNPQGFLTSVQQYFTTFTDLQTFQTNNTIDAWSGMEYVSGNNIAAVIGLSYNTPVTFGGFRLGVEDIVRNAPGVGTIIYSEDLGINLQFVKMDTKAEIFVDGGYDWQVKSPIVTGGARVFKALSDNTFAVLGISERLNFHSSLNRIPTILVGIGCKL